MRLISEKGRFFRRIHRWICVVPNPFWRIHRGYIFSHLYSVEAFESAVARERRRLERYGGVSTVVVLDCAEAGGAGRGVYQLAKVLLERMRFTDILGWVEDGRFGVLLPDTDEDGASVFVERMRREAASSRLSLEYELATSHPVNTFQKKVNFAAPRAIGEPKRYRRRAGGGGVFGVAMRE